MAFYLHILFSDIYKAWYDWDLTKIIKQPFSSLIRRNTTMKQVFRYSSVKFVQKVCAIDMAFTVSLS